MVVSVDRPGVRYAGLVDCRPDGGRERLMDARTAEGGIIGLSMSGAFIAIQSDDTENIPRYIVLAVLGVIAVVMLVIREGKS